MQQSQTLSSAIAQIKVSNSPITNHTKKTLPKCPPPFFNFCVSTGNDTFLAFFFKWGMGFPALFFFLLWLLLLLMKKDFKGFIDVFPLQGGVGGVLPRKILEGLECRKSHLPHF